MVLRYLREQTGTYGGIAEISPRPPLVSYWTVKGLQAAMLPLQVEKSERDKSSADAPTADHSRRHNLKRAHDEGEEGEGRKHDQLHDWGVSGISLGESWAEGTGQSR